MLTFHCEELVGLFLLDEIHLSDVAFAQEFDLLERARGYFDLVYRSDHSSKHFHLCC